MNTPPLRIAMLGMMPGNDHAYSWSAIVNGYDPVPMAKHAHPAIAQYLGAHPLEEVNIPGAQVTHIWTDQPDQAGLVAQAAKIPNVVDRMETVIGEVDAVIIPVDDGTDHVRRARPFVEAGIPVFIDKPLATTADELRQFSQWKRAGAKLLSSSGMRYAKELDELKDGDWSWISGVTCKSIERYAIHVVEPIYTLFGPGFSRVQTSSQGDTHLLQIQHHSGRQATVAVLEKAVGSFGTFHAHGVQERRSIQVRDTYTAFRHQLLAVIDWFRTGVDPIPYAETEEMMAILLAALESKRLAGPMVSVPGILDAALNSPR